MPGPTALSSGAGHGRVLSDITSSPVLLIPANMSVKDAAELMHRARTDAGLVEAEDGALVGILTDSDVSIKVIASGRSVVATTVYEAMTPRPLCVRESETAGRALALMTEKRSRHLPLLDDSGNVSGMLDIAKVLYDAINRLESSTNNDAFPSTRSFFSLAPTSIGGPTLSDALAGRPPAATALATDALGVAFEGLVRTRRSVLVLDGTALVGILSKSDVAKRALRAASVAGRDDVEALRNLRVGDVMTPRPDSIQASRTVLDALHKMHDGKYSNLPVLNDAGVAVGVVDVLDLLRASAEEQAGRRRRKRTASEDSNDSTDNSFGSMVTDLFGPTPRPKRRPLPIEEAGEPPFAAALAPVVVATPVPASSMMLKLSSDSVKHAITFSSLAPRYDSTSATAVHSFCVEYASRVLVVEASDYQTLREALQPHVPSSLLLLEYDQSARMRIQDDRTLQAAVHLHATLQADATTIPLKLTLQQGRSSAYFLAIAVVALAATLAIALRKAR